jgi:hypothetical protein
MAGQLAYYSFLEAGRYFHSLSYIISAFITQHFSHVYFFIGEQARAQLTI